MIYINKLEIHYKGHGMG